MKKKIILLALPLLLFPFGVFAGTGLTIQPVKVSQSLSPSQETSGTILLTNASEDDVQVEIKVEDFIPTAGAETIQFVGRAPGITTVRDWITVNEGKSTFLFKKNEQKEIPYTIKAPANAEPGSHFGVIFFKATNAADADSQIKVGTQVGVLTFITVPGAYLQKGRINSFTAPGFVEHGPVPFTIHFENTGTVHFEPKGSISISNMFGKTVGIVPIEGQVVLPTGIKNLNFAWVSSGLLLGKYTAQATIKDGEGNILTSDSVSFYAMPVWYTLFFLVTLVVIFIIIKVLKSRIKISVNFK